MSYSAKRILIIFFSLLVSSVFAQNKKEEIPEPGVVTPVINGKAPSDAIILFDKGSLNNFESVINEGSAPWKVKGKMFTVKPGTKAIRTKQKFRDCQLHIEWKTPIKDVSEGKTGQHCGNSGIFFMCRYEIQVLNSYINKTEPMGQAGAFYSNFPPLVNASVEPGKWQVYDIIFKAPKFNEKKELLEAGAFTVFHNGVLVQNHVPIEKPYAAREKKYKLTDEKLPLMLQDHASEVSYRNIWIREL